MAIRLIKSVEIFCDTCKKIIATGKTSTQVCDVLEKEEKYTELFCTDCVKLPAKEETKV